MKTKQYKTPKKTGGRMCRVANRDGSLTPYKLYVPYSTNGTFTIGTTPFHIFNHNLAKCLTDIPQAWFVDLNAINGD